MPVVATVTMTSSDGAQKDVKPHHVGPDGIPYRELGYPARTHREAVPHRADFRKSPHKPVIVTPSPVGGDQAVNGVTDVRQNVPCGRVFDIETPAFTGRACFHLRGLPGAKGDQIFDGKKRYLFLAFQGVVRKPCSAAHWVTGQEFVKPLPKSLRSVAEFIFNLFSRVFASSSTVHVGDIPYFYNPMAAAAQMINISRKGEEPDILTAEEDVRLWAPECKNKDGTPWPADKRRKYFDDTERLKGRSIGGDPNQVVTIHVYQHLADLAQYKIHAPWGNLFSIDLATYLAGQPVQFMSKNTETGDYFLNFLVWHERLLYNDEEQQEAEAAIFGAKAAKGAAGGGIMDRARSSMYSMLSRGKS